MPELTDTCRQTNRRFWQMEQFMAEVKDQKEKTNPSRAYEPSQGDVSSMFSAQQSPKKTRAKESSKHFGVRFRPDLQKWVAEIRVAEWKSVDKKVWLGTFDSEEGAARAVDAARKLLKCKKKRPPNFDCQELQAYCERIPANLDLTNLGNDSMFKDVTVFVKRKAQEYAAGFCLGKAAASPCLSEQLPLLAQQFKMNDGNRRFHLTSDMESRRLFTLLEDDVPSNEYSPSSYESYGTQFPSCESLIIMSHPWNSPTSVTYSGPPSCSPAGTSPDDGSDGSWVHVLPSNIWSQEDQWVNIPDPLTDLLNDPMLMDDQTSIEMDDPHLLEDYHFNMDIDQDQCHVVDQATTNPVMNTFLEEQMMCVESQNNDWVLHQSLNSIYTGNSLSNSLEYAEVC